MSQPSRIPFAAQLEDGYCLPACATMVLAALGMKVSQRDVAKRLATGAAGTPFSRLHRLAGPNIRVEVGTNGTLDRLFAEVQGNRPVVAAVHAGWLPHAEIASPHAVVVIDASDTAVTILDPAGNSEPIDVPIDAWVAAWVEMDCVYAIIARQTS